MKILRILYHVLIFKSFNVLYLEDLNISQLDYEIIIFSFIIINILFLKIFIYYNYVTII